MSLEPPAFAKQSPKTSPAAIWSLVLGILSITCLWIIGSIPAIILGIVGMRKVDASPETVSGRGLALSGIITGGAGILLGLIPIGMAAAITLPAFNGVQQKAHQAKQVNDIRMLSLACRSYAIDNDGLFPAKLTDLVPDYIDAGPLTYQDPNDMSSEKSYLYRPGFSESSPSREPFLLGPEGRDSRRAVGFVGGMVSIEREPIDPDILAKFE